MNNELKPGMMALVIGLKNNTELNGLCVNLICQPESSEYLNFDFDGWISGDWICSHPEFDKEFVGVALFDKINLMPINPEADPLHTKEEQHASA